ncbi:hypothetical protein ACOMHN_014851 [Nucella lapillus]
MTPVLCRSNILGITIMIRTTNVAAVKKAEWMPLRPADMATVRKYNRIIGTVIMMTDRLVMKVDVSKTVTDQTTVTTNVQDKEGISMSC